MDGAIDTDDLFDAIELHSEKLKQDANAFDGSGAGAEEWQRKYNRLQREKDDDQDFYNGKIRQLKRRVTDCQEQITDYEE
jgi:hypothetical protein